MKFKAMAPINCYSLMPVRTEISETILATANERGVDKSTCPSEIARMLFPDDWRKHMEEVRDIAIALHREGKVVITQKGIPVDVDHIKGPVRIKINL
ncbi:DUF3253 domain-containing protein [Pedobacter sp. Leaf250]|uniref:DUF3253 domain-containing protein n=1 Tax=Pedobacter sp. Leaf250 TaxID=2876559 RepID=UPI001E500634|nr:DUF3253 domain-containing protein [Pedobacter sp. Leaf250]